MTTVPATAGSAGSALDTVGDLMAAVQLASHLPSLPAGVATLLAEWVALRPLRTTRWVHLERHWHPATDRTDVIVAAEPHSADAPDVWSVPAGNAAGGPEQLALQATLQRWFEASQLRARRVGRCWLEFDAPAVPVMGSPGCFVDAPSNAGAALPAFLDVMAPLVPAGLRARAATVIASLRGVASCRVHSVGWLSRAGGAPSIRLCLSGAHEPILDRVIGAADAAAVCTHRAAVCDPLQSAAPLPGLLHLDVTEHEVPTVGLELMMRKGPQLRGVLLEAPFFAALAASGLCAASELEWIRRFAGAARCGPHRTRLGVRRVSHVKFVYRSGALHAVKTYVAFGLLARAIPPQP